MTDIPTGQFDMPEPGVLRLTANNPSPFTNTGTQSYVVGITDVAVIDPGPAEDEAHLAALIAAIGARPVVIQYQRRTADDRPARRHLQRGGKRAVVTVGVRTHDGNGPRADASFDRAYAADRVLGDGEAVSGAGWTLTALATPGHTSNHLCFVLEESKALFSGDHVMGWSTSIVSPPDGDMGDYMRSLDLLLRRDDRVYYPGHGPEISNPQRLVRGMMGHRKQREGAILRLLRAGTGDVDAMVAAMYAGLDRRMHPAAARSVLAHLIDLRQRGLATGGEDGEWAIAA